MVSARRVDHVRRLSGTHEALLHGSGPRIALVQQRGTVKYDFLPTVRSSTRAGLVPRLQLYVHVCTSDRQVGRHEWGSGPET